MLCGSETAKTWTKQIEVCVCQREREREGESEWGVPKGKKDERRQTRREVCVSFRQNVQQDKGVTEMEFGRRKVCVCK